MEKKFIAVATSGGNSGDPKTREACLDWAKKTLSSNKSISVRICEVIEVVSFKEPPIQVDKFMPEVQQLAPSAAPELIKAA